MNSLSWMIYFANVAGELRAVACIVVLVAVIATAVCLVRWKWFVDFGSQQEEDTAKSVALWSIKNCAIVAIAAALLVVFVPSKDTIYAIAASEMGEEVIKSPEASKARAALNAWLDKQIGDEKPEK